MNRRSFLIGLMVVLACGAALRLAWLRSDPPVQGGVGIVWHDEGAWVHNARNRALWGAWRTDEWNPMFVAPVFTALEFAAFKTMGVGTWQARTVPAVSGLAAVVCLVVGLTAVAGRRAGLIGGGLLAVNYAFVMWNRAALMESTMTACIVAAWGCYALAERRPAWGLAAGVATTAAWFTKASAAFFVGALAIEVCALVLFARRSGDGRADRRTALMIVAGLGASFLVVGALFVWPHWTEYRFYNWQMSVTRKPEYSLGALADRASWLPLVQGLFSRMWIELAAGSVALLAIASRGAQARPAERLLVWWVLVGLAELVVHDSGNERRYVMFIPAIVALAAVFLAGRAAGRSEPFDARWPLAGPVVAALALVVGYLVVGSLSRPFLISQIEAGHLSLAVRLSALAAIVIAATAFLVRARLVAWLAAARVPPGIATGIVVVAVAGQAVQTGLWVSRRSTTNYDAGIALGRLLPDGTVVQGKLANGFALDTRIRPIFVGNGFGNYADRLRRDDARYILTYDLPRIGFESSDGSGLIQGILEHYPRRRVVATFVVDETPAPDRAALIDKFPETVPAHARD